MRPLPVILLVAAAIGVFFLAMNWDGAERTGPAALEPADGSETVAAKPDPDEPADLQTPEQAGGLQSVEPREATRENVTSSHATLANSIRGVVQLKDGKPIEGATVTLTQFGQLSMLFGEPTPEERDSDKTVLSEEDGSFLFRNVETYTEFSLIASDDKHGRQEEGNIQVAEGESKQGIVMVLGEGVRFHGRVSDTSGNSVPNAKLFLGVAAMGALADQDSPNTLTATSAADGAYEYSSVASGNYSLTVVADGYGRVTVQQINITGQADVERDVVLDVAFMIAGMISGPGGIPIGDAKVQAFSMTNRKESTRSETASTKDGNFLLDDIRSGTYTLMVNAPGYRTAREPRVTTGNMAVQVELTPLPVVRGRVVDSLGQPVLNFTVQLRTPIQNANTTMALPETAMKFRGARNGEFVLPCPNHGEYVVESIAGDYAPSFSERFEIVYGEELSGVVIQMTNGGTMRGRIVDSNGNPIAGARVKTHDTTYADDPFWRSLPAFPSQATQREVRTADTGDFEVSGLAAATYQIDVRHAEYSQFVKADIIVEDGSIVDLPDVKLSRGAQISGTVYGPSGKGLPGALVQLQLEAGPTDWAVNLTARTDAEGRYHFNHVPGGNYHIHAQRRGDSNPFQGSVDLKNTKTKLSVVEGESYTHEFNISN